MWRGEPAAFQGRGTSCFEDTPPDASSGLARPSRLPAAQRRSVRRWAHLPSPFAGAEACSGTGSVCGPRAPLSPCKGSLQRGTQHGPRTYPRPLCGVAHCALPRFTRGRRSRGVSRCERRAAPECTAKCPLGVTPAGSFWSAHPGFRCGSGGALRLPLQKEPGCTAPPLPSPSQSLADHPGEEIGAAHDRYRNRNAARSRSRRTSITCCGCSPGPAAGSTCGRWCGGRDCRLTGCARRSMRLVRSAACAFARAVRDGRACRPR